jgi:hypothetical protein
MTVENPDKMHVRAHINESLEFLIKESIYYRSNNENILEHNRLVAWHMEMDSGKIHIP